MGRSVSCEEPAGDSTRAASRLSSSRCERVDLARAFPDAKGFSARNLKYMRAFAEAWPDEDFVQQAAARLPWFHNLTVIERLKDEASRRFYLQACAEHGWSRAMLIERRRTSR